MERAIEDVWQYPRPPSLLADDGLVEVWFAGECIARSSACLRVCETSHPPTWYIPPADFRADVLVAVDRTSLCEWKGQALYFDVRLGDQVAHEAAWCYPKPSPAMRRLANFISVYPGRMERCLIDGEVVQAQAGDFYGGWITSWLKGPFKGPPGTRLW